MLTYGQLVTNLLQPRPRSERRLSCFGARARESSHAGLALILGSNPDHWAFSVCRRTSRAPLSCQRTLRGDDVVHIVADVSWIPTPQGFFFQTPVRIPRARSSRDGHPTEYTSISILVDSGVLSFDKDHRRRVGLRPLGAGGTDIPAHISVCGYLTDHRQTVTIQSRASVESDAAYGGLKRRTTTSFFSLKNSMANFDPVYNGVWPFDKDTAS